ncbi:hypothetical protein FA95DRAFT_1561667 [Auriscalpium vulgare]|uniref:Uncharacterized protein n=1 Tax=Auriscalpium vulgare TaxID=40419 RepID=A0ACB8RL75_9AGAM|nr:hypothetical protein FA95DRAFT_1561667 [Auriscalpium vulgare]
MCKMLLFLAAFLTLCLLSSDLQTRVSVGIFAAIIGALLMWCILHYLLTAQDGSRYRTGAWQ